MSKADYQTTVSTSVLRMCEMTELKIGVDMNTVKTVGRNEGKQEKKGQAESRLMR